MLTSDVSRVYAAGSLRDGRPSRGRELFPHTVSFAEWQQQGSPITDEACDAVAVPMLGGVEVPSWRLLIEAGSSLITMCLPEDDPLSRANLGRLVEDAEAELGSRGLIIYVDLHAP